VDRRAGSTALVLLLHKIFSIVIVFTNTWLVVWASKHAEGSIALVRAAQAVATVVAALYCWSMSVALQPVHLLLAAVMFGLQFFLWVAYRRTRPHANDTAGHEIVHA